MVHRGLATTIAPSWYSSRQLDLDLRYKMAAVRLFLLLNMGAAKSLHRDWQDLNLNLEGKRWMRQQNLLPTSPRKKKMI